MSKKLLSIPLVLMSLTVACNKMNPNHTSDDSQNPSAPAGSVLSTMPDISPQNSATCGGVSIINGNTIGTKFCSTRAEVLSTGPEVYVSSDSTMSADTIEFSLWSLVSNPQALQENVPYELVYKRLQDGRIETAPNAKILAAAAFRPQGVALKQLQLKGFIMFPHLPRKTGDSFTMKFNLQSQDGTQSIQGLATGTAQDSPYMKPDNN